MKKFVKDILNHDVYGYPVQQIDTTLYIFLDDDRRVTVSFYNTHSVDNYNAIKLSLISKTKGNLDTKITKFSSIFKEAKDLTHPNKISKHIWHDGQNYSWYGKPTKEDIEGIVSTVKSYVVVWE